MESQLRHRRRMQRSQREQTPQHQLEQPEDYGDASPQRISMQIRAPGVMSAHESKILRRRDKSFAGTAARSQSQPREAEKLSNPDAQQLLVKHRSLSSPRHKEQEQEQLLLSSESELTGGSSQSTPMQEQVQRGNAALSRLEQNLQRFEDERRRFEAEKRLFEREKREHKQRHRQQLDHEERKRLLQNYRKISDGFQLPQDEEDRRRLVQSLRLQRHEVPTVRNQRKPRSSGYEESSTQFSSSDADTAEEQHARSQKMQPGRKTGQTYIAAAIRGAPPPPPPSAAREAPKPPERHSVSRNNSLSPVRPQRRSKTPEQRPVEETQQRKQEYVEIGETAAAPTRAKLSEAEQRDALRRAYEEAAAKAAEAEAALAKSLRRSNSLRVPVEVDQAAKVETKRSSSLERPARTKRTPSLERPTTKLVEITAEQEVSSELVPAAVEQEEPAQPEKPTLLRRFGNLFVSRTEEKEVAKEPQRISSSSLFTSLHLEMRHEWRRLQLDYPVQMREMRLLRNKCIGHLILLILLLGFGGLIFRYTEGMSEDIYKCEVRKVKRDFIDNLWSFSHNMRYLWGRVL